MEKKIGENVANRPSHGKKVAKRPPHGEKVAKKVHIKIKKFRGKGGRQLLHPPAGAHGCSQI